MEYARYKNREIRIKINFQILIFFILIQIKGILLSMFDSLETIMLNEDASLIDVSDYHDLYLIVTTDKKIYTGIPPTLKSTTSSSILNISSAVTYNNDYILMACTENNLLSKINIETGEETYLVPYGDFKLPNSTCSLSAKNNDVYIAITNIIVPSYKIPITDIITTCSDCNDATNINDEDNNYYIYYDVANSYLENTVIKVKLESNGGNPILDTNFDILNYTFAFKDKNLDIAPIQKPFSCEIIDTDEDSRLICGHIRVAKNKDNALLYYCNATLFNSDFDDIEDEISVDKHSSIRYIRIQRKDETHIKYLFTRYSFEITVQKKDGKYKLVSTKDISPFYEFFGSEDLFFYNNGYLLSATSNIMYVKKSTTSNYITATDNSITIEKIIGYYKADEDKLLFVYAYDQNKIKYLIGENINYIFSIEAKQKIFEVQSGTTTVFNVNELITSPAEHDLLSFYSLTRYISTREHSNTYDKYSFVKENQTLTIQPSDNDWVSFSFYFDGVSSGISFGFYLEKTRVILRTCLFKCGKCYQNISECDIGTCKTNFATYKDNEEDQECYPVDQNFPYYIYNKTTDFFEKCYTSCIFCSKYNEISSSSSHNCKVCKEGYLKSYKYLGNCYKVDYPHNTSQYYKIVNNIDDEEYTIVDSCNELKMINDTGECIESCPTKTSYFTYYKNESLDFSQQQETYIGLLYPLQNEKIPQYLFNKVCYTSCPKNTQADSHKECQCKYAWHYNISTGNKICYEHDYCLSLDYYYHKDNKECVLNGCNENYYQLNFECYKNACPANTEQISPDIKKCESTLAYCYIDDHYKTKCSNTPYNGYNLKYDNTKTYFKSCNESLYYFNTKTYLYKNICHINCPEGTTENDENNRCKCNNYIYYVNEERSDYECFDSENECLTKGFYFDKEIKECFQSEEVCISNNKKIFGKECLTDCPINSEIKQNPNYCVCSNYFYNNNGILNCFNSGKKCEDNGFPITTDIKECFSSIDDCFSNNYLYYYDKTCYKDNCPSDKIPLNSIGDTAVKTALVTELSLDTALVSKLCICDTQNTYYGWINRDASNPSLQQCLNECPLDYDLDATTQKCYYYCDPLVDFVFNDNCYKNFCPESTRLDPDNPGSRQCVCEGNTEIDPDTGLTRCTDIYPDQFYRDQKNCPYFYQDSCCKKCPDNTCLSANNADLVKCIDFRPNYMKQYNGICIEGINDLVNNIIDNDDDHITPIITPSGVALSAVSTDVTMNEFISKYPDLTYVDLGQCEDKLREAYHLPPDMKMFVIGIDSPNYHGNSSINVFNYEIYLKNGTKIHDLSPCDTTKVQISSSIKDLDSTHYSKAQDFYEEGYDIYNRSSLFYVDQCAPAQDDGNDITLEDRAKYYYPNVSICNEGCKYNIVDFETQRFLCDCNANLNEKKYKHDNEIKEEIIDDASSYLDYFLSLINYKIFLCMNLFFEFESFYYNAGFYISFCTMLVCIVLMILFCVKGMKFLKIMIYKNIPTKEKLNELLKKRQKKEKKKHKTHRVPRVKIKGKTRKESKEIIINQGEMNNYNKSEGNKLLRKKMKCLTISNKKLQKNNSNNNPPPRTKNISNLHEFIKERKRNEKKKKEINNNINNKEIEFFDTKINSHKETEKKNNKINENIIRHKKKKNKTTKIVKNSKNILINKEGGISNISSSSKENLFFLKNKISHKSKEYNPNEMITRKGEEDEFDHNKLQKRRHKKRKTTKKSKKKLINLIDEPKKREYISSIQLQVNDGFRIPEISRPEKRYNTVKIIRVNFPNIFNLNDTEKSHYIHNKKKMLKDLELRIDFNFDHLIDRTDDDVEKRELNNIPYRQALRIDKRSLWEIFISILINKLEFISLFVYRNPYSHYTLTISIYLYELLVDLTMNCFLYTDEVVSEKYHNNGELTMFTSLSLSFISNIVSSIIVFIIAKLTNYTEIIESIVKDVKDKKKYIINVMRLFKYIKIRLGIFYFLQLSTILIMTYYLFIFCTVYHQSQGSIMVNYIIGACISLAISTGLTIIITILRVISIKYHYHQLFNISKYLYDHF